MNSESEKQMTKVNWDAFRDHDGCIDLVEAFLSRHPWVANSRVQEKFLSRVTELTPIRSKQAAAVAIATAVALGEKDD